VLTADLVRARRRGNELVLSRLSTKQRARAEDLAEMLLGLAQSHVGRTREELHEAWGRVDSLARERRLVDGLRKLIEDGCEFSAPQDVDPVELRRRLFSLASEQRCRLRVGEPFDRAAVVSAVAAELEVDQSAIEESLYSDLRGAHRLLRAPGCTSTELVNEHARAQVQAVLLRAVRVTAKVACSAPAGYRALLHQLKFRRLLYRAEREEGGYRLHIDGPLSLFGPVTKYGLQLALVLPALEECDVLELEAEVRWGKHRQPLTFRYQRRDRVEPGPTSRRLPDDVVKLMDAFSRLGTEWRCSMSDRVLDLPGIGVCVPDLVFEHPQGAAPVYLEVLGYWSREAVWRRVELVEQGLGERILFAVSSRLRVSEAVLDAESPGALYVYKGVMSARSIERKLDELGGVDPKMGRRRS
jgi:predicted nuclease of restriction endonuclease-like RecB superfamily